MISNIDVCTSDNYFTKNTPKVIIMDFNDLISIDTESLFDLLDLPQVVDNDFTSKKFLVGLVGTSGDQVQPPCCSWVSHSRLHRKDPGRFLMSPEEPPQHLIILYQCSVILNVRIFFFI